MLGRLSSRFAWNKLDNILQRLQNPIRLIGMIGSGIIIAKYHLNRLIKKGG